jgi:uncharacterized membrane protein (DUF485 family)
MYADIYDKIKADPEFTPLVKRRRRFSLVLTLIMLCVYFSFILTIAYKPEFFGQSLAKDSIITLGIPVGIGVIIIAFVLTGFYVQRANTEFDTILNRLKEKVNCEAREATLGCDVGVKHD